MPRSTLLLLALGFAGAFLALARRARHPVPAPNFTHVRDAGTGQMRLKPLSWDLQDETLDESFPASDPPGTY